MSGDTKMHMKTNNLWLGILMVYAQAWIGNSRKVMGEVIGSKVVGLVGIVSDSIGQ
jgi:hypothetical protein